MDEGEEENSHLEEEENEDENGIVLKTLCKGLFGIVLQ